MSYWPSIDLTDAGQHVLLTSRTQDILFVCHWPHRPRTACPIDFTDPGIMSHWALISQMQDLLRISYWPHRPKSFYVLLTSQSQGGTSYWHQKTQELCPINLTNAGQLVLLTSQTQDILFMFYWPHRPRTVYISYWLQRPRNYVPLTSQTQDILFMPCWPHRPRTFCLWSIDLTDPGQYVLLTSKIQELCPTDLSDAGQHVLLTSQTQDI